VSYAISRRIQAISGDALPVNPGSLDPAPMDSSRRPLQIRHVQARHG
jgi:hypothetical protein